MTKNVIQTRITTRNHQKLLPMPEAQNATNLIKNTLESLSSSKRGNAGRNKKRASNPTRESESLQRLQAIRDSEKTRHASLACDKAEQQRNNLDEIKFPSLLSPTEAAPGNSSKAQEEFKRLPDSRGPLYKNELEGSTAGWDDTLEVLLGSTELIYSISSVGWAKLWYSDWTSHEPQDLYRSALALSILIRLYEFLDRIRDQYTPRPIFKFFHRFHPFDTFYVAKHRFDLVIPIFKSKRLGNQTWGTEWAIYPIKNTSGSYLQRYATALGLIGRSTRLPNAVNPVHEVTLEHTLGTRQVKCPGHKQHTLGTRQVSGT
ncbi:hypothetical protein B7494_g7849 [Chlorociboria aeruginascens]|nr:hypothetical protein B7494_g7849 [Chlorociboria aeruginascens]